MKPAIFILLLSLLQCCKNARAPENDTITYIHSENLREVPSLTSRQLIDSCTYIPLETSPEVLIGNIRKLKVTNRHIFLINDANDSLYVFDRQGRFLNTIGSEGRGPREYLYLYNYCLTADHDTVILYDPEQYQLLFYTTDNRYLNTINLYDHLNRDSEAFRQIHSIHAAAPGKLLILYYITHLSRVAVSVLDYQKNTLKDIGFLPCRFTLPDPRCAVSFNTGILSEWNHRLNCCLLFNDTIFYYKNDTLLPHIVIPAMKDKTLSLGSIHPDEEYDFSNFVRRMVAGKSYISSLREDRHFFYIAYADHNDSYEIIWDKDKNQGILTRVKDSFCGFPLDPESIPASFLLDEKSRTHMFRNRQLEKLQTTITEDDNPIIVIYHPKSSLDDYKSV